MYLGFALSPHAVDANTFLFMLCGNEWVVVVVVKGVLLL